MDQDKKGRFKKGNRAGLAVKGKEARQEAYKQYCDHISAGKPKQAFYFDHPEYSACWETMDKYLQDISEFDPNLMKKAKATRYLRWFNRGENLVDGKVKGNPSPQAWQTIMRNMFKEYKWDQEVTQVTFTRTAADDIADALREKNK